jgi:hypothetical protein
VSECLAISTPGVELLVRAGWAAVAMAGGLFLITRRDA